MSIRISDKATGRDIGEVSEQDFAIMSGHMEEESSRDQDYYVESTAIEAIEHLGASSQFVALLRDALGSSEGIDIVWSRD